MMSKRNRNVNVTISGRNGSKRSNNGCRFDAH